ncbi:MAG: LLM class flavin-dependent oxidoreductase [Gammaproteobacteria bacterium]
MEFGIAGLVGVDSWKTVKRAEALGFSHAWYYDSPLYVSEIFVSMAAAAMQTSRIRLGFGTAVPSTRIAPTMAAGLASLNKLAPGRIDCGLGTGNTARSLMGCGPLKLSDMEEYLRVVQALLEGDIVEFDFEGSRRKIKFMHPVAGLVNTTDPIGWHLSAMGPRSRRLTASLGAGWINFLSGMPSAVSDVADMRTQWRNAGRSLDDCQATGFTLGCVLGDTEPADSPRAMAQAGPHVALVLQHLIKMGDRIDLGTADDPELARIGAAYQAIYDAYEPPDTRYMQLFRGHLMWLLPEEKHLITGELIRRISMTGTQAELRERIRALGDAGYRQIAFQLVPGHEDALDDWADVIAGL